MADRQKRTYNKKTPSQKSLQTLYKSGVKIIDVPSPKDPHFDKYPENKMRRNGEYLLEKASVVGWEMPGEYFKHLEEVIDRNSWYLFRDHKACRDYLEDILSKKRLGNLID